MLFRLAFTIAGAAALSFLVYKPHLVVGVIGDHASGPERVVSLSLASDEILLELLPQRRIVGLTYLVDDPQYSNVVDAALGIPRRVRANPEQIIALHPDLVVIAGSAYSKTDVGRLLESTGIRLHRLGPGEQFSGIAEAIVRLGRVVRAEMKARQMVRNMDRRINTVRRLVRGVDRPRVLYLAPDGFTAGRKTNIGEMISIAGGINLAERAGIDYFRKISSETIVTLDPEVILLATSREPAGTDVTYTWLHADPALRNVAAVRNKRLYTVPQRLLNTLSHHAVAGAEAIARLLHPERINLRKYGINGGTNYSSGGCVRSWC